VCHNRLFLRHNLVASWRLDLGFRGRFGCPLPGGDRRFRLLAKLLDLHCLHLSSAGLLDGGSGWTLRPLAFSMTVVAGPPLITVLLTIRVFEMLTVVLLMMVVLFTTTIYGRMGFRN